MMKWSTTIPDLAQINWRQLIKLVVYVLLLINFGFYIRDDWSIAQHTLGAGSAVLDWTSAFATTIDESAWFILLLLFELETYVLSDDAFTRRKLILIYGIRFICYAFLVHTLFAYVKSTYDLSQVTAIKGVSDLCELSDNNLSFTSNLEYTELDGKNCSDLSHESNFFLIEPPEFLVVTDGEGLVIEKQLVWVDLLEAIVWLFILFSIELNVRLQDRGIATGTIVSGLTYTKILLYGLLWAAAAYWIYRGHWMFAWDEFVWIAGFTAIEMNMVEWREEINPTDIARGFK